MGIAFGEMICDEKPLLGILNQLLLEDPEHLAVPQEILDEIPQDLNKASIVLQEALPDETRMSWLVLCQPQVDASLCLLGTDNKNPISVACINVAADTILKTILSRLLVPNPVTMALLLPILKPCGHQEISKYII